MSRNRAKSSIKNENTRDKKSIQEIMQDILKYMRYNAVRQFDSQYQFDIKLTPNIPINNLSVSSPNILQTPIPLLLHISYISLLARPTTRIHGKKV